MCSIVLCIAANTKWYAVYIDILCVFSSCLRGRERLAGTVVERTQSAVIGTVVFTRWFNWDLSLRVAHWKVGDTGISSVSESEKQHIRIGKQ